MARPKEQLKVQQPGKLSGDDLARVAEWACRDDSEAGAGAVQRQHGYPAEVDLTADLLGNTPQTGAAWAGA